MSELRGFLPSGKLLPVETTQPNDHVDQLRSEFAHQLKVHPACLELVSGDEVLEDKDLVPEAEVLVVLRQLDWLDGGSGAIEDKGGGEFTIRDDSRFSRRHMVALCDVALTFGLNYFEIHVVRGDHAFVGITTQTGFQKCLSQTQTGTKGLVFGGPGDLSDTARTFRPCFGSRVCEGDIIGCEVDLSSPDVVSMNVWQNGFCLGQAFRGCQRRNGVAVFPVVFARSPQDHFRIAFKRQLKPQPTSLSHPAEGSWQLQEFQENGNIHDLTPVMASQPGPFLRIRAGNSTESFETHFRIGSGVLTTVTTGPYTESAQAVTFGGLTPKGFCRLDGAMHLEHTLLQSIPKLALWEVSSDSKGGKHLLLRGDAIELSLISFCDPVEHLKLP